MIIEYESANGYKGKLYGESSFSIYNKAGKEVFHTYSRAINSYEELKEQVDNFPEFLKMFCE